MEEFSHDYCDKTLHFIPCPLCKYYVRSQAGACNSRLHRCKYVCDICDHCKRAHDRQLQDFFNLRQKELKLQIQNENPYKDDRIGLLREFFKSLVPHPGFVPDSPYIRSDLPMRNTKSSEAPDEPDCDDVLRFKSISEPFEHRHQIHETKKTRSLADPALIDNSKNEEYTETSFKEKLGNKLTKGDSGGSRIGEDNSAKRGSASIPEKGIPNSPSRGLESSPKAKSSSDSSENRHRVGTASIAKNSTSVPNTQKLAFNVDDRKTRQMQSKIMQNIRNGGAGVMSYALSNRKFIDNGYTKLPTTKQYRYEMKPADPELDWFGLHKSKGLLNYDTGEPFAMVKDDRYQLFYRNGDMALDHYDGSQEKSVKYRTVVYDTGQCTPKGERSKKNKILAIFDDMGNGIIYDSKGNVRLEYNQSEGVVYDKSLGTPARWQWHNLNEPPELKEVLVNTELPRKDKHLQILMTKYDNLTKEHKLNKKYKNKMIKKELDEAEIVALENDRMFKLLRQKNMAFKQFEIQMKAVKLNDQGPYHHL